MSGWLRARRIESVVEAVGDTPLLRLRNVTKKAPDVPVYAKLEFENPGGSVKDRAALRMIQDARKQSGLEVTDRIALAWTASDPEMAAALREHGAEVGAEVLATSFAELESGAEPTHREAALGLAFVLKKA